MRTSADRRYEVDSRFISANEAIEYLVGLTPRDRKNFRRTQAWFDHCARIRCHLSSGSLAHDSGRITARTAAAQHDTPRKGDTDFYKLDML